MKLRDTMRIQWDIPVMTLLWKMDGNGPFIDN